MPTGSERQTVTVLDGAMIRGRLVHEGKPVPNAEIGLIGRNRGYGQDLRLFGDPYPEVRIGTQRDGSFLIPNVPVPGEWYIYGKMESIAARGASDVLGCATTADNQEVNVGDIQVKPSHRLRGKVVLSDGKAIPEGSRILISHDRAWDSQTTILDRDGRFEFAGLGTGKFAIDPAVEGYSTLMRRSTEVSIDRDFDELLITLDPQGSLKPFIRTIELVGFGSLQVPAIEAYFEEHKIDFRVGSLYDRAILKTAQQALEQMLAQQGRHDGKIHTEVHQISPSSIQVRFILEEDLKSGTKPPVEPSH